jgi:hypothetical protein
MKTCIQCHKLVDALVQIKPGRGQIKPPQQRCAECARKYRELLDNRKKLAHE